MANNEMFALEAAHLTWTQLIWLSVGLGFLPSGHCTRGLYW